VRKRNSVSAEPQLECCLVFCRPFPRSRRGSNSIQVIGGVEGPIDRDECILHSWACPRASLFYSPKHNPTPSQLSRNPTMVASDIQKVISIHLFLRLRVLAKYVPRSRQSSMSNWQTTSTWSYVQQKDLALWLACLLAVVRPVLCHHHG
jgi:hypothetical protein